MIVAHPFSSIHDVTMTAAVLCCPGWLPDPGQARLSYACAVVGGTIFSVSVFISNSDLDPRSSIL